MHIQTNIRRSNARASDAPLLRRIVLEKSGSTWVKISAGKRFSRAKAAGWSGNQGDAIRDDTLRLYLEKYVRIRNVQRDGAVAVELSTEQTVMELCRGNSSSRLSASIRSGRCRTLLHSFASPSVSLSQRSGCSFSYQIRELTQSGIISAQSVWLCSVGRAIFIGDFPRGNRNWNTLKRNVSISFGIFVKPRPHGIVHRGTKDSVLRWYRARN